MGGVSAQPAQCKCKAETAAMINDDMNFACWCALKVEVFHLSSFFNSNLAGELLRSVPAFLFSLPLRPGVGTCLIRNINFYGIYSFCANEYNNRFMSCQGGFSTFSDLCNYANKTLFRGMRRYFLVCWMQIAFFACVFLKLLLKVQEKKYDEEDGED